MSVDLSVSSRTVDKKCEDIKNRKIIDSDMEHVPQELKADGKILMGPPILT